MTRPDDPWTDGYVAGVAIVTDSAATLLRRIADGLQDDTTAAEVRDLLRAAAATLPAIAEATTAAVRSMQDILGTRRG